MDFEKTEAKPSEFDFKIESIRTIVKPKREVDIDIPVSPL